ncbi:MAG: hypothetical protein NC390_07130 [Fusobacterium sp.]|nr:hypothetical protein [Fusobacterium sp.]
MIEQVSAINFGRHNAQTTLFSRQHQAYEYRSLEPLTSAEVRKEKEHTAMFMTLGGIAIATGLFALLGKLHAKGVLSEIKDPDTVSEHIKSWVHKTGESANSMGKTIKGWFSKKK